LELETKWWLFDNTPATQALRPPPSKFLPSSADSSAPEEEEEEANESSEGESQQIFNSRSKYKTKPMPKAKSRIQEPKHHFASNEVQSTQGRFFGSSTATNTQYENNNGYNSRDSYQDNHASVATSSSRKSRPKQSAVTPALTSSSEYAKLLPANVSSRKDQQQSNFASRQVIPATTFKGSRPLHPNDEDASLSVKDRYSSHSSSFAKKQTQLYDHSDETQSDEYIGSNEKHSAPIRLSIGRSKLAKAKLNSLSRKSLGIVRKTSKNPSPSINSSRRQSIPRGRGRPQKKRLSDVPAPSRPHTCIYLSRFEPEDKLNFTTAIKETFNSSEVIVVNDVEVATHLVIAVKPASSARTSAVLLAIARGIWVLGSKWLNDSLSQKDILPPKNYEVGKPWSGAAAARVAHSEADDDSDEGLLFSGYSFNIDHATSGPVSTEYATLSKLIRFAGGSLTSPILSDYLLIDPKINPRGYLPKGEYDILHRMDTPSDTEESDDDETEDESDQSNAKKRKRSIRSFDKLKRQPITIVTNNWLLDCIEKWKILSDIEYNYAPLVGRDRQYVKSTTSSLPKSRSKFRSS
jgi:hypothetical protein